jgi:predicted kinase
MGGRASGGGSGLRVALLVIQHAGRRGAAETRGSGTPDYDEERDFLSHRRLEVGYSRAMFRGLPTEGLTLLIGSPASGKSTFAKLAYPEGEVLATDGFRTLVGGTADNLDASAFSTELLLHAVRARCRERIHTVVDSTGTEEGLLEGLEATAASAGVPMRGIVFKASLDVCLQRNARRAKRVPEAVVGEIARRVSHVIEDLSRRGIPLQAAESFVHPGLLGKKAFLAMPYTELLGDGGFRADRREFYQHVHAALSLTGLEVTSAAVREDYGAHKSEPREYAEYDIEQVLTADMLLVTTTTSVSPDTCLEIGVALGHGKPVGVVLPQRSRMTGLLRGLIEVGRVASFSFAADDELASMLARMAIQLACEAA